jgi:hypothetical protein
MLERFCEEEDGLVVAAAGNQNQETVDRLPGGGVNITYPSAFAVDFAGRHIQSTQRSLDLQQTVRPQRSVRLDRCHHIKPPAEASVGQQLFHLHMRVLLSHPRLMLAAVQSSRGLL